MQVTAVDTIWGSPNVTSGDWLRVMHAYPLTIRCKCGVLLFASDLLTSLLLRPSETPICLLRVCNLGAIADVFLLGGTVIGHIGRTVANIQVIRWCSRSHKSHRATRMAYTY